MPLRIRRPPPPPELAPPPALVVLLVLNQTEPYIEFIFNDSRYSKTYGRKHTLTICANGHLDCIRLERSSFFGIRFLTTEGARSWYDIVEAPWCYFFSRESSTSQTVWIRRGFSTDDLMRKMPLPTAKRTNSWWNKAEDKNQDESEEDERDARGRKSERPTVEALANGLSKVARKAVGRRN